MHIDTGNAAVSSIIGVVMGILWNVSIPQMMGELGDWILHTIGAVLTALLVAFCVYHFNRWMKKKYEKST